MIFTPHITSYNYSKSRFKNNHKPTDCYLPIWNQATSFSTIIGNFHVLLLQAKRSFKPYANELDVVKQTREIMLVISSGKF